jgi:hypothetical protein
MIDAVVVVLNAEILRCVSDALAPFEAQGRLREREEKASFISAQDDKFLFFACRVATLWRSGGIGRVAGWARPKHGIIRELDRTQGSIV